ncbi:MarR family winged helix-turn-helix transcriptional regulator [Cellulomonas fengjieae]|uniref:MarR family transcriptional regulator n=1 Tax=Cellulomonas fengjieae TaxID=2819978 RepID=A0ABS3SEE7_9CELL|nr:MarR family transcriptional regulator [Cellulomonas fengjieae]MBO3084130.1 MarR family transcriptional regulator [Cellulomonas fengjieae]MBO3103650.1 MarR family transcriptional regulator [Cellulomonas fengjieae]QVI64616.1 MarR family transcriptional regulator [Cellulomonas fengjieae]
MQEDSGPARALDPASPDPAQWPVGRLLSAASRRVERDWNAHLANWDLNHASLPVLAHLQRGPMSQRELAAACGVTEQTTSRVLARMERTGYVTRSPHPDDRRRHVIAITDAGRQAFIVSADRDLAENLVTRDLTAEQAEQLRRLLAVVALPDPARRTTD